MIHTVFLSGLQRQFAKDVLREAARTNGCLVVKNSPFAENTSRTLVQDQLRRFYELELAEKVKVGTISGKGATRGYFKIGSESGNKDLVEQKESFSFGYDTELIPKSYLEETTLVDRNLWHPSFNQDQFYSLLQSFNQTTEALVELCSDAFGVDLSKTIDQTSRYQSFIRSFKYIGSEESKNITGNSLHSDWNLLTLVWTDSPGLQFLKDDGTYQDIHDDDPGSLICNFGDFIASLTDGKVRSPWHKVVLPGKGENRHSLVHFYYPSSTYPAVRKVIYQQNRPLGLFVDQSKTDGELWNVDESISNMGQMYSEKWKQVSRTGY